jgi:MFS family permease
MYVLEQLGEFIIAHVFRTLTREQKEAVGLLQIGTFLEYFDLMLYMHMAVFLNEIFFPKTDPHTAGLLTAFAFCSTFVLRPFGALLFGYLGDNIGRKSTVIITTMMMAISCITIANLPTYAQIGISAAWIITGCRIVQGLSSMGEIIGAEIYLSELTKPPARYPVVSLIGFSSALGTTVSLAVASLFTAFEFNWRIAFWIGAAIAVIGSVARTRLRETSDFSEMKKRVKHMLKTRQKHKNIDSDWLLGEKKVGKKTALAYFMATCAWPACFYFAYIHCGSILKNEFGYTAEQVIHQNFFVSIAGLISCFVVSMLSYKIHPIKIAKLRFFLFFPFILVFPLLMKVLPTADTLFFVQLFSVSAALSTIPAASVIIMYFPVLRRFTYTSAIYALSRALVYVITSFGLVHLTELYGYMGILVIMIPTSLAFYWGMRHFEHLEQEAGVLPYTKEPQYKIVKVAA